MNLSPRATWLAYVAIILATLVIGVDLTMLNVALPTLAHVFSATEPQLQWIVAAYTLVFAVGMLPAGYLGDRVGIKPMFIVALVIFGLGSGASVLAANSNELIAARAFMGLGAALIGVLAFSAIAVLFPSEKRAWAVGIACAAGGVALPLGPILGGWLVSRFWWGWLFLMNVPVTLIAIVAMILLFPSSRPVSKPRFDLIGALLSGFGVFGFVYGVILAGHDGWGNTRALVPLSAGVILFVIFLRWEIRLHARSQQTPLVDLSLFRSRTFGWGTALNGIGLLALAGVLFIVPQYLAAVGGFDVMSTGIRILPLVVGFTVGSLLAAPVATLLGRRATIAFGYLVSAAAFLLGTATVTGTSYWFTGTWTAVIGIALGIGQTTAASTAVSQLPTDRSGAGSALMQIFDKQGIVFGVAIIGSAFSTVYANAVSSVPFLPAASATAAKASVFAALELAQKLHSPGLIDSVRRAFLSGMSFALTLLGAISIAGALAALVFLPVRHAKRSKTGEPAVSRDSQ